MENLADVVNVVYSVAGFISKNLTAFKNILIKSQHQRVIKSILMLKLKLQYFGHLMRRANSFEKTLMLGKIEGGGEGDNRGWDGWMASLTQWTWVWVDSGSCWWTGRPGVLQSMGLRRVGHDWATELNWIESVDQLLGLSGGQPPSPQPLVMSLAYERHWSLWTFQGS